MWVSTMAKRRCDYCGKPVDAEMLKSGLAVKVRSEIFCRDCDDNHNLSGPEKPTQTKLIPKRKSGSKKIPKRKKNTSTVLLPSSSVSSAKGAHEKMKTREDGPPDVSFGENLARASSYYRPRSTSNFRPADKRHKFSTKITRVSRQKEGLQKKQWKFIAIGVGLLAVALIAIKLMPAVTKLEKKMAKQHSEQNTINSDFDGQDPEKDSDGNGGGTPPAGLQKLGEKQAAENAPATSNSTPAKEKKNNFEPNHDEIPVLLVSDLDIDAEGRADRKAWRLKRGTPAPGQTELLLGDFEESFEILYWTFQPRAGIEAWMGTKSVTSGTRSIRIRLAPITRAQKDTQFNLILAKGEFWNWTGAKTLACDAFNPTDKPYTVNITLTHFQDGKEQTSEWQFTVPAHTKKYLDCPVTEAKIDFGKVTSVGFRIPRLKDSPIIIYLDKFVLTGKFGP